MKLGGLRSEQFEGFCGRPSNFQKTPLNVLGSR